MDSKFVFFGEKSLKISEGTKKKAHKNIKFSNVSLKKGGNEEKLEFPWSCPSNTGGSHEFQEC